MELQMIKFRIYLQLKPKDEFIIDLFTKAWDEIQYGKNLIFIKQKLPISRFKLQTTDPLNQTIIDQIQSDKKNQFFIQ